jgi:hypothetical protein
LQVKGRGEPFHLGGGGDEDLEKYEVLAEEKRVEFGLV